MTARTHEGDDDSQQFALPAGKRVCLSALEAAATGEKIGHALLRVTSLGLSFLAVVAVFMSIKQGSVINNQNLIIARLDAIQAEVGNLNAVVRRYCPTKPRGGASDGR